jgi:hypothetical protein
MRLRPVGTYKEARTLISGLSLSSPSRIAPTTATLLGCLETRRCQPLIVSLLGASKSKDWQLGFHWAHLNAPNGSIAFNDDSVAMVFRSAHAGLPFLTPPSVVLLSSFSSGARVTPLI